MFPDREILVDVTVVHPSSPSRTSKVRLAAATAAEALKVRGYAAVVQQNGASFLAFAVETFGGFGKQADELLRLANESQLTGTTTDGVFMCQALAVALQRGLQRGNATVIRSGVVAARLTAKRD